MGGALCLVVGPVGSLAAVLVYSGLTALQLDSRRRQTLQPLGWIARDLLVCLADAYVVFFGVVVWSASGSPGYGLSIGLLVLAICLPGLVFSVLVLGGLTSTWANVVRRDASHCGYCDYDLSGNLSGACPECGRPCQPRT